MDVSELETAVRDWLGQATVNPQTGLPPDARVSVSAQYVSTIGTSNRGTNVPTPAWRCGR